MKKIILAVLLVVSVSSFAQEQTPPEGKSNKPKREKQTPEQRSQAQLEKLTTELTLNSQQQEQIKPILAEQNAKMEAMRAERMNSNAEEMTDDEREAFKVKRQEDRKATNAKLQAILTPEQFKKLKDIEKANMEKMRESRGNWGNRDNGSDRNNGDNLDNKDNGMN
jgi:protein CpxP